MLGVWCLGQIEVGGNASQPPKEIQNESVEFLRLLHVGHMMSLSNRYPAGPYDIAFEFVCASPVSDQWEFKMFTMLKHTQRHTKIRWSFRRCAVIDGYDMLRERRA